MSRDGHGSGGDRFRAISAYVHWTHVFLAAGTIIAPAVAFAVEPRPSLVIMTTMLSALLASLGASVLVAAEFAPHHRVTHWLRGPRARAWTRVGVLAMVLIVAVLPQAVLRVIRRHIVCPRLGDMRGPGARPLGGAEAPSRPCPPACQRPPGLGAGRADRLAGRGFRAAVCQCGARASGRWWRGADGDAYRSVHPRGQNAGPDPVPRPPRHACHPCRRL